MFARVPVCEPECRASNSGAYQKFMRQATLSVGRQEARTLVTLRDAVLPRLLSAELRVPAAAQAANEQ